MLKDVIVCRLRTFLRTQKIKQGRLYSYATAKQAFSDYFGKKMPHRIGRESKDSDKTGQKQVDTAISSLNISKSR